MHGSPTLYKINRHTVSGESIVVETTHKTSCDKPHILFCGGFHSSMRGVKAEYLSQLCRKYGWGFTRFDYRGHGESDADVEYCSLHDWLADTLEVIAELEDNIIMIGSSMGAWLATHASLLRPEKVSALLTIAAAPDFTEKLLWPTLSVQQKKAIDDGQCVSIPTRYDGEDWRMRVCLFDSGRALALLNNDTPLELTVPIRMLHGSADTDVPWTLSQQLLNKFSKSTDATLTIIRGADHRLSDERCLNEIKTAIEHIVANLYH